MQRYLSVGPQMPCVENALPLAEVRLDENRDERNAMGRPKTPTTSAELSVQIARVQQETQAQLKGLEERRRLATARENMRRGELVRSYLKGPKGIELRRILRLIVEPRDHELFDLQEQQSQKSTASIPPVTGRDEGMSGADSPRKQSL